MDVVMDAGHMDRSREGGALSELHMGVRRHVVRFGRRRCSLARFRYGNGSDRAGCLPAAVQARLTLSVPLLVGLVVEATDYRHWD